MGFQGSNRVNTAEEYSDRETVRVRVGPITKMSQSKIEIEI